MASLPKARDFLVATMDGLWKVLFFILQQWLAGLWVALGAGRS